MMKKNRMMRLASGLLVAVLITTSMISGTFAKYTTQDSASDVARVAKWGVELQVVGDLYGENYKTTENIASADSTDASVTSSATGEDVVAPGTKNDLNGLSFTLNGKPEVSTKITTKVIAQNISLNAGEYGVMVKVPDDKVTAANHKEFEGQLYIKDKNDYYLEGDDAEYSEDITYYTLEDAVTVANAYYPVVYGINGGTNKDFTSDKGNNSLILVAEEILNRATNSTDNKMTADDAEVLYTAIKTSDVYAPNKNLADLNLSATSLKWEWKFCQKNEECDGGNNACEYCKADTILGYMIAECKNKANNSEVVYKAVNDEDNGSYTTVEYSTVEQADDSAEYPYSAYSYATAKDETIASLTTQFYIDITVTQVD